MVLIIAAANNDKHTSLLKYRACNSFIFIKSYSVCHFCSRLIIEVKSGAYLSEASFRTLSYL